MHTIGRIPRWLIENDPSWERSGDTEHGLPEWAKKGSELRAKCNPTEWYCDVTIRDRHQGFDLSEIFPNLSPTKSLSSNEFDLRNYVSSRYLNPGFDANQLGTSKIRKYW